MATCLPADPQLKIILKCRRDLTLGHCVSCLGSILHGIAPPVDWLLYYCSHGHHGHTHTAVFCGENVFSVKLKVTVHLHRDNYILPSNYGVKKSLFSSRSKLYYSSRNTFTHTWLIATSNQINQPNNCECCNTDSCSPLVFQKRTVCNGNLYLLSCHIVQSVLSVNHKQVMSLSTAGCNSIEQMVM